LAGAPTAQAAPAAQAAPGLLGRRTSSSGSTNSSGAPTAQAAPAAQKQDERGLAREAPSPEVVAAMGRGPQHMHLGHGQLKGAERR